MLINLIICAVGRGVCLGGVGRGRAGGCGFIEGGRAGAEHHAEDE